MSVRSLKPLFTQAQYAEKAGLELVGRVPRSELDRALGVHKASGKQHILRHDLG